MSSKQAFVVAAVICASCQKDNPDQAAFCMHCGSSLAPAVCTACAEPLPPDTEFCPGCGLGTSSTARQVTKPYTPEHLAKKILTSRSAMEGEVKQLTVVFTDVKESMKIADVVGAERWHHILDGFFALLARCIHRFEGTINQFTGDGVMALFGAPIAHEDHAKRACHAALMFNEEVKQFALDLDLPEGLDFQIRTALNSGEVIVGRIGDDLRMDYTAQSHAVGLAARLQHMAAPGEVYLAPATARLVVDEFETVDVGVFEFKGVSEPLPVVSVKGRADSRNEFASRRKLTSLVGRNKELQVLEQALESANKGHGKVLSLVGEAGAGKSRLCHELVQRCQSAGIKVLHARCASHGHSIPFLAIYELLKSHTGLLGNETEPEVIAKVTAACADFGDEAKIHLPLILKFLGVSDQVQLSEQQGSKTTPHISWLLEKMVRAGEAGSPQVLIIEDLHWIDLESERFIREMVELIPSTATFLILDFRPDYQAAWLRQLNADTLPINRLTSAQVGDVIADLTGPDLADDVVNLIADRAEGNPFFVEEIIRGLIEAGVLIGRPGAWSLRENLAAEEIEATLPASVQALIASRIDRLDENPKAVLQLAAVFGREFNPTFLAAMLELTAENVDKALEVLKAGQFLRAPSPGETEFNFEHSLTQEVAYRSQLGSARRHRHAAIATAMMENEDIPDNRAAFIAHHWESAGDYLQAARARATGAQWLTSSGHLPAAGEWGRLRNLTDKLPPSKEVDDLRLRACEGLIHVAWHEGVAEELLAQVYKEAVDLMADIDDLGRRSFFHVAYGRHLFIVEDADAYLQQATIGFELAEQGDDPSLKFQANAAQTQAILFAGKLNEGYQRIQQELSLLQAYPEIAKTSHSFRYDFWVKSMHVRFCIQMGKLDLAKVDMDWAMDQQDVPRGFGLNTIMHLNYALWNAIVGDADGVRKQWQHARHLASEQGGPYTEVAEGICRSLAHLVAAELSEAAQALLDNLELARSHRVGLEWEADMLAMLTEIELRAGNVDAACSAAKSAIQVAAGRKSRTSESLAHLMHARAALAGGSRADCERAVVAVQHALQLAQESGARTLEGFAQAVNASIAARCGDQDSCSGRAAVARDLFAAMGSDQLAEKMNSYLNALQT